jgi:predicted dehydrogenase
VAEEGAVWGDAHRAQIQDLIRAIRTNSRPLIDGAEGRKPVEIILGVYESAKSGKTVRL